MHSSVTLRALKARSSFVSPTQHEDDLVAQLASFVDERLRWFGRKLGGSMVVHPFSLIGLALLLACLCSGGFISLSTQANQERLFTPSSARTFDDNDFAVQRFGRPGA